MVVQHFSLPPRDPITAREAGEVARALSEMPGLVHAYVSSSLEMAYVLADESLPGVTVLVEAVARHGFGTGR